MTSGRTFNFTQDNLKKITPPTFGRVTYKDTKEKGLILIASYGGSKTFYYYKKIKGKPYRLKIGAFPDLSVGEARDAATELKNKIAKGANPAEDKNKLSNEMTLKQLFDKYIEEYAKHNTKTWQRDIVEMDNKAKHLYNQKISSITKDVIQKLFNQITEKSGKIAANRFIAKIQGLFNKAINDWGWQGVNPAKGITKHKSKSRDRYLTKEEMPHFFEALNEEENIKVRDYIWLSLLTGARKDNVLSLKWQDVSFQNKSLYLPDTKNDTSQVIPLVPEAIEILKRRFDNKSASPWVFPSKTSSTGHLQEPKKVWNRVRQSATIRIWLGDKDLKKFIESARSDLPEGYSTQKLYAEIVKKAKKCGVELPIGLMDLWLHDLRRSLGSWMAHSGASQYIIGKSLNHKSPKSTEVYARLSIDPVRDSMSEAVRMMYGGE